MYQKTTKKSWPGAGRALLHESELAGKETQTVVQALAQHVQRLPAGLMTTLTGVVA